MDDWAYPHPDSDTEAQAELLEQDWRDAEDRRNSARQLEVARRAAETEQAEIAQAWASVNDPAVVADVPVSFGFAAPFGVAVSF